MTATAARRRGALAERLAALDEVVELAAGRLDPVAVAAAARLATKAGDRLRLGEDRTVVALAGATGSGKSSLFNAVVGSTLSAPGLLRPTTAQAHAAVWGDRRAGPLLDWLEVPRRHLLGAAGDFSAGDPRLDGLVLLDLPDVDSVRVGHRLEVDRLIALVDLMVWVLDPQKYADAAVHERYLVPLAGHAGVTLVVLNQVDRLDDASRAACLADLRRILAREGLGAAPVLVASARTGEGVADVVARVAERVAARRAAVRRIEADLGAVAASLDAGSSRRSAAEGVARADRDALVAALTDAAGAELVADAVARTHRARGRRATGWPFTRWLARLRPSRARRLHLPEAPNELVRTALPGPSPVQRARVDIAVATLCDHVTADLPAPWPTLVRGVATASREELPDQLDRAVAGVDLGLGRRPRWWTPAGAVQVLLAAAALVGAGWLVLLAVLAWLRLPAPPLPTVGELPVPTALLLGGVLLGLLLALLSGRVNAFGARRRAARVRRRLAARVREVADKAVLGPVAEELSVRARLTAALARLRPQT